MSKYNIEINVLNGDTGTYDQLYPIPSVKSTKITLTTSGWSSSAKTQKVTVSGVLADETKQLIQPIPTMASQTNFINAGIICSTQENNALTFKCQTIPSANIEVFVIMQNVTN